MKISGLVITYNEENWIGSCIDDLLRVCDEVIVVDSFSTDRTVEIAEAKGANVIRQKFLGDGPQRTFGWQYCKNDWVLNLDADERLDQDAYEFIASGAFIDGPHDAYQFKRKNYLGDKLMDFSGGQDSICRFYNKQTARHSEVKVHQNIIGTNKKMTDYYLIHYSWDNYGQMIHKKNLYTDWQVDEFMEKGKRFSVFAPVVHGVTSFMKFYFIKKGIFNGLDGLTFSLVQSFFSYMKYAKAIQQTKKK